MERYQRAILGGEKSIDGCRTLVAEIPFNGEHTHPSVEANARLIALAPEMREALESSQALMDLVFSEVTEPQAAALMRHMKVASALLARVEGA